MSSASTSTSTTSSSSSSSSSAGVKKGRIPENAPLTEAETKTIQRVREQFGEQLGNTSENTIIRFVRGYKDDPNPEEKALEMLGKMLKWRQEQKVDSLLDVELPRTAEFTSLWTSGVHGVGKSGHPVYIDRVGAVDGSKLMKAFSLEEIVKFHVQMMEKVTQHKDELSKQRGERVYKQIVVLDVGGIGMSHLGKKFTEPMKAFIHIDQDYYPETLAVMIVINAGWILKSLWALVSPWLDPITRANIKFGTKELFEYVDADQLPRMYGGTCQCEGGKCLQVPFVAGNKQSGAGAGAAAAVNTNDDIDVTSEPTTRDASQSTLDAVHQATNQ